jgi:lipoprotein-releasing system permease protein
MLFTFAKRYLFSTKKTKAINIISWVSITAIAIGTAALITVLSVFNGLDFFVRSLYTTFYTDVKISNVQHTAFHPSDSLIHYLKANKNIVCIGKSLEDQVLLSAGNAQNIITLKGIDSNYASITQLNKAVKYGDTNIFTSEPRLSVGLSIANRMSISEQTITPVSIFTFKSGLQGSNSLQEAYTESSMYVANVFSVQEEFDNKYCLTSLEQMQAIMQDSNAITAFELQMKNDDEAEQFVNKQQSFLASQNLVAETRYQQNKTLYYVLKSEKWMVFAIMSFMLLIASFNMVGSISMLVMEKKKDISILKALGNTDANTKNIFLGTGIFIGLFGAMLGSILAVVICGLQSKFKIVKMAGENFLLDAYPVKMLWADFVFVFATVVVISILASWWPSRKAVE